MPERSAGPAGWATAKLGDGLLNDIQTGFACGVHNKDGEGIPHLRPMNVSVAGDIDLSDLKYIPRSKVDSESKLVKSGDVIFNNTNSPELVGKTAYHMTRLRCNPDLLLPKYLAMYLHGLWRRGYFKRVCNNHVSQSSVSRKVLSEVSISFPPLAEQHRIVAAIEVLFARLDATNARLERVPGILKQFRQAVLAAACDGRLTEDWRIDSEGRVDHQVEKGISESILRDLFDNFELPSSWIWTNVGKTTSAIQYGTSIKADSEDKGGVPVLRMGNIQDGKLDLSDLKYIFNDEDVSAFFVQEGDILFNRTNSPELVGKCAIVKDKLSAVFASYLMRIKCNFDYLSGDFLCFWIIGRSNIS
jgi:type I restriction enzyme S subunit